MSDEEFVPILVNGHLRECYLGWCGTFLKGIPAVAIGHDEDVRAEDAWYVMGELLALFARTVDRSLPETVSSVFAIAQDIEAEILDSDAA